MKFAGTLVFPLYVAPYVVPEQLITDCGGEISFDVNSKEPIIRTTPNIGPYANTNPYFHCIVPSPFDFGESLYNPTGTGHGGASPGGQVGWDGQYLTTFTATDGDRPDQILATLNFYGGRLATQFGIEGQIYNAPPISGPRYFNNNFTEVGADPGTNQQEAPYYANIVASGVTDYFGAPAAVWITEGNFFCTINSGGNTFFLIKGLSDATQNIGFPLFMNEYAALWAPNVDNEYYRWYPTTGDEFLANTVAPLDTYGPNSPFTLTLDDHPELEDCFSTLQNGNFWVGVSTQVTMPGNNFTVVLINPSEQSYYTVQLVPKTPLAVTAVTDTSRGLPSVKLRSDGVLFLNSPTLTLVNQIFHSQGFILDYQPINVPYPPPFVLPCFNPCLPLIKSS